MNNHVILVDELDNPIGQEEKMAAHKNGLLHRAFSIFIFNNKNELLLQRRALEKYHSGGLWSNTCCSHPRPDEELLTAAHRRLKEELGFDTNLTEKFSFVYSTKYQDLYENEFDHVLVGRYGDKITPDRDEVMDYKWESLQDIEKDVEKNPDKYSYWFKIALNKFLEN